MAGDPTFARTLPEHIRTTREAADRFLPDTLPTAALRTTLRMLLHSAEIVAGQIAAFAPPSAEPRVPRRLSIAPGDAATGDPLGGRPHP